MNSLPEERSLQQRIASNSLIYFLSQVLSKGFFFLTTVYLARVLGASTYGKFAFAFGLVTILSIVTKFGMDPLLSRNVGENPGMAGPYLAETLALRSILTIPFFFLLLACIAVLGKPLDVNLLILLLALSAAFQSFAGAGTSLLEALQMFFPRSLLNVCMYGFVLLGAMIAFYCKPNLISVGIGFAVASFFYAATTLWFSNRKAALGLNWNKTSLWKLFRSALPLGLSDMFVGIYYRADSIFLSLMQTDAIVGWYDAAYSFVYGLRLLPVSFAQVLLPTLSRLYAGDRLRAFQVFRKSVLYSAGAGIVLTALVAFNSDFLVSLFFGKAYQPSSEVLPLLIWTCSIMFVTALQGIFLILIERRSAVLKATAAAAISNTLLNVLLIPKWSMKGAAIATVVSQFIVFLYCTRSISNILPLRYFVTGANRDVKKDIMIDEKHENLSGH